MISCQRRVLTKLVCLLTDRWSVPAAVPDKRFVLLTRGRSGSTWVMDLLQSHLQIVMFGELFRAEAFGKPQFHANRDLLTWQSFAASQMTNRSRLARLRVYFRYLDEEVYRPEGECTTVGFKLMYDQAATSFGLVAYLLSRQVALIHLIRRNHLDAILSEEARNLRNVTHAHRGTDVPMVRIELDRHTLLGRLEARERSIDQAYRFCHWSRLPCMEVFYEDLLSDPSRMTDVLRFLNVEPANVSLTSTLQKLNPTDHRQLIVNYKEIAELLQPTRFAILLR